MKTKKRKKLELEANLLGNSVFYSYHEPAVVKHGDRWYDRKNRKYYIFKEVTDTATGDFMFCSPWVLVKASNFFDITYTPDDFTEPSSMYIDYMKLTDKAY